MEDFLRRVLPETGPFTVMMIDSRLPQGDPGRVRHVNGIQSIEAMVKVVQRLSMEPLDLYYAVGSFAGRNRAEPTSKRCLYLDLDAKDFGDKANAITQLQLFVRSTGIVSPSILVDSGRGIHVYWVLDTGCDVHEWRTAAQLIKSACAAVGFSADAAVTADAMRVLRIPGTLNHKGEVPVPCTVLKDWGTSYSLNQITNQLAPKQSNAAQILAGTVGDDLGAKASDYAQIPYFTSEIVTKCGVFKDALATGGKDHVEPLWSNILSTIAFTEDAEHFVHPLSEGHPGYDRQKVDAKFAYKLDRRLNGQVRPVLCTTFAQYKGSICAGCPYNGRIKTPLVLGKREEMAHLPPWIKVTDKGVLKKTGTKADDGTEEWKMVFPYHIGNVELIDRGIGELMMRATFTSKSNVIRTEIPTTLLAKDGSTLSELLVSERVLVGGNATGEFKGFMMPWLKTMSDIKQNSISRLTGLGWGERGGQQVFCAGQKIFTADGKEDHFSHPEASLLNDYTPHGKADVWERSAKLLLADGRQAAAATLMTAFSAPLMKFTGSAGLTFSIYSAASGTGKSSLLKVAQSVWGHPVRGVNALDDTFLSVTKKLGFLNTLPAYWDEMRGDRKTIHGFVKMIFQLGQGKEKSRLTSSIKMQEMGTWNTLITMASNERVNDHMDQITTNTNAGRLRVFEVTMPEIKGLEDRVNNEFSRDISVLAQNYGHAGQKYAKYIASNHDKVRDLVQKMQDKVAKDMSADPEERFWVAFVAAEIAAALLVNQLGILEFPIPTFQKWLYAEFKSQRSGSKAMFLPPEQNAIKLLLQYMDEKRDGVLVTEHMGKTGVIGACGAILVQPKDKEILILKAHLDKKIRVKINSFKQWLYNQEGFAPTPIIAELMKTGAVIRNKGSVSAGLANTANVQSDCLTIDLTHPSMAGSLDAES